MTLIKTLAHVDADDLATSKEAAVRDDVSEAAILRDAIRLAAARVRRQSEPLQPRRFASGDPTLAERVGISIDEV
ncbi:hypothetical protein [Nocardia callitridis]|uniref:Ribbon-helix-helix protein CopG domain-containing protein n=1 Tax=Nocardia callitridis TaxID=648753 RepID=A0ABP9JT93_9NOCA